MKKLIIAYILIINGHEYIAIKKILGEKKGEGSGKMKQTSANCVTTLVASSIQSVGRGGWGPIESI